MLKPSDIVDDVRRVFQGLPKGKATHNRHWVNAYVILARLPLALRQQLVAERGAPGEGSGHHYAAASVVADACEILCRRGEAEVEFMVAQNATYEVDGYQYKAGYELCGIYRLTP